MSETCYAQNENAEASSSKYIETSCWCLKYTHYAQNVENAHYIICSRAETFTADSGQFLINYAAW